MDPTLKEKIASGLNEFILKNGVANITIRDIRSHFETELNMSLEPHKDAIKAIVIEALREKKLQKELAKAQKELEEGPAGGRGRRARRGAGAAKSKQPRAPKEKSKKEKKPDNYPKNPQTPYFIFMMEHRAKIVEELNSSSIADIGKEAGRRWKELTDAERAVYEGKAEEDKARYKKEMDAYIAAGGKEISRRRKASKRKRDPDAPKRSPSAYMLFMMDNRAKISAYLKSNAPVEIAKEAGRQWKELSDEKKKYYEDKAKEGRRSSRSSSSSTSLASSSSSSSSSDSSSSGSDSSSSSSDSSSSSSDSSSSSSDSSSSDSDSD